MEKLESRIFRTSSCWIWTGIKEKDGYGFPAINGTRKMAHRLVYEALVGPIPPGLTLDHLCEVRACVNPDHLRAVTAGENSLRGNGPPARNARKTHCPLGHQYTEENTRISRTGKRNCKACERLRKPSRHRVLGAP